MEQTMPRAIVFEKGISRVTYNYDFAPFVRVDEHSGEEITDHTFKSVSFIGIPTSNVIKQAVIEAEFPVSKEQKLTNEYNHERIKADRMSAANGRAYLAASEKVSKYEAFLERRDALLAQVDADCQAEGIE